jgi:uncharacterized membrane protein
MAISILEKTKRQNYLLIVLLILILITSFVIWRGFFYKKKSIETIISKPEREIKIDFETLKNPIWEELQPFEKINPPGPEIKIGRENPFIPY